MKIDVATHSESSPPPSEELVVEWKPRTGRPFHGRVYQNDAGRYRLWTSDAGWFLVDPAARSIAVESNVDPLRREVRLLTTPMLLLMVERGDLPLHASAVEIDGRVFLFGAPSRFGKTTMAAGFHVAGHRVLAEDVTCVQLADEPVVLPGPALLRIRNDVATRMEFPRYPAGRRRRRTQLPGDRSRSSRRRCACPAWRDNSVAGRCRSRAAGTDCRGRTPSRSLGFGLQAPHRCRFPAMLRRTHRPERAGSNLEPAPAIRP